ncbi:hypothetical protein F5Y05DRAFT_272162 [Hypoxylon sp. FL0543]|nr:hypothetical protein F5Y05DRAFT_272162 [Hypoxylon sp. FL0543]
MYRPFKQGNIRPQPSSGGGPVQPPPVLAPVSLNLDQVGHPKLTREHISTEEDPYAFLGHMHTKFIIDDSVSMAKHWDQVSALFQEMAPFFPDGIQLTFVNHGRYILVNRRDPDAGTIGSNAKVIFESVKPCSQCRLGRRLKYALKGYIKEYLKCLKGESMYDSIWPMNVIVVTAGAFDDDIVQPLMWTSIALDLLRAPLYQVGVQFFHVKNEKIWALHMLQDMADEYNFRNIVAMAGCGPRGKWSAKAVLDTVRNSVEASILREEARPEDSEDDSEYEYDEEYDSEWDEGGTYLSEITIGMESL